MVNKKLNPSRQSGFTLIELSIVLVIIGLIVGGVLVGQDMISAARIRSGIGDIEKFNAAAITFRTKYNGLPGDLTPAKSAGLDFGGTRAGTRGTGDGNGLIEGDIADGEVTVQQPGGETICFWRDLRLANLTHKLYEYGSCNQSGAGSQFWPTSSLDSRSALLIYSPGDGLNYFFLTGFPSGHSAYTGNLTNSVTPLAAYQIDTKLDDGKPMTGIVRAMSDTDELNVDAVPDTPASGVCVSDATGEPYNMESSYGTSLACQLRIRASF